MNETRVYGISDLSYERPFLYLKTRVPQRDYFGKNLKQHRLQLLASREAIGEQLTADLEHTDVIGALHLCQEFLGQQNAEHKRIVIFSDLRQSARGVDVEANSWNDPGGALKIVEREDLIPELKGIEVECYNVLSIGRSPRYWKALRSFWESFSSLPVPDC